jgi:hypothetical protein
MLGKFRPKFEVETPPEVQASDPPSENLTDTQISRIVRMCSMGSTYLGMHPEVYKKYKTQTKEVSEARWRGLKKLDSIGNQRLD